MKIPLHLSTSFFSIFMVIASEARVLENWMTSKGRESLLKHGCFYRYIERSYKFLVN